MALWPLTFDPSGPNYTYLNNVPIDMTGGSIVMDTGTALTLSGDTPVGNNEATPKWYVDQIGAGLSYKTAVEYGTTVNLSATYNNGASGVGATLTMNSVGAMSFDANTPSVNDRILVKNQTNAAQNGIYVVTVVGDGGTAGILTRSSDYDNSPSGEIALNNLIPIVAGATQGNSFWRQSAAGPFTIGTTDIDFVIYSTGIYTGGSGIDVTGSTISIQNTGVTSAMLASDSVITAKILNANVTYAKLQNESASSLLGNPSGSPAAPSEITLDPTLTFSGTTLQRAALTGDVTASAGSNSTTIANNAITTSKISDNNVTLAKLATQSANTFLANATAGSAVPTAVALSASQLAGRGSSGNIAAISPDGTTCQISGTTLSVIGAAPTGSAGGDLTGTYPNPTIGTNKVTYTKFVQGAASSLVGNPTGSTANAQDITLNSTLSFSGTTLQRAALTGDVTASAGSNATTIANDAVTYAKMQNASANTFLARAASSSGDIGEVALSASQLAGRGSTGDIAAISLGAGLSMSGSTLIATGASSSTTLLYTSIGVGTPIYNKTAITASSTRQTIYTCPAGKKAAFMGFTSRNQTGSTATVKVEQYDGSTYWPLARFDVGGNGIITSGTTLPGKCILTILEAGHQLVFNNTIGTPASHVIYPNIIEFPNTVNIKTSFVSMPNSATNYTVYTCPASTTAFFVGIGLNPGDANNLYFANDNGSSRTITTYSVPSGDSPGISNMTNSAISYGSDTFFPVVSPKVLTVGGTIQASLNNAGPFTAWVNVMEFV